MARFASVEAMRWLAWGIRSYQSIVFRLALILGTAVLTTKARRALPIGWLMGLAGLAYVAQGWSLAVEGSEDQFLGHCTGEDKRGGNIGTVDTRGSAGRKSKSSIANTRVVSPAAMAGVRLI